MKQLVCLLGIAFLFSCKNKTVYYTPEEARRIADSAAQEELRKIEKEAEIDLEFRKRVETPYQFGVRTGSPVRNPYDSSYSPAHQDAATAVMMDSTIEDSANPLPTPPPEFKKIPSGPR